MTRYYFAERVWLQSAFLILATIPATLIAWQLDARMVNDISIWIKPLKFQVSTALHLMTLAVLARFLTADARKALWLGVIAAVSALSGLLEIILISGQSARGLASHFNRETSLDVAIYALMGIGALLLILPALVVGLRFLFASVSEKLTPGLKLGAGLGLTLGFFLTLFLAGYMSMGSGHWIDAPATDAGGVPIFGWSRQGGDLRVPHFFATHLMQVLPLVGYVGDKLFGAESSVPRTLVWLAAFVGAGLAVVTFLQAMAGQPFIG